MLKLRKIAITGGLSCGKSSVCRFLKELGAYVVSADEIVHQLLSSHTNLGQQVIALLGPDIVVNGHLDRKKIANKVFNRPTILKSLENLLHPAVFQEIEKQYQIVKNQASHSLFVAEIPLLFETEGHRFFDATVAVIADKNTCRERFKAATRDDDKEFDQRMERQLSPEEKGRRADYILYNEGTLQELEQAVKKLYNQINPYR